MATIATRLSNTGTLLVNGSFDENTSIAPSKFRTTSNTVFSNALDEVSLAAGGVSFNGTNQYLSLATNAAFSFGTGDYTIEFWMFMTSYGSTNKTIIDFRGSVGFPQVQPVVYLNNSTKELTLYPATGKSAPNFPLNTWVHVATTRSSSVVKLFIDGTQAGSSYTDATSYTNSAGLFIGTYALAPEYFPGYISNLRVVKGTALYTANTAPPTSILPAIANTSLLLNVTDSTNFIKDNGPNKFTVTNANTATFNTNGPFNRGVTTVKQRQVTDGTLEVYSNFDEFTGAPVVDASLVLWLDAAQTTSYPGTGTTWTDLSGKGNNGTLTSGPTYNVSNGGSIGFNGNGSGNYVSVSDSVSLRPANITVCTWTKFNSFNSTNTGVITKPQNSTVGGGWTNPYLSWMIRVEGTGTMFDVSIGSSSVYYAAASAYSFSTNTWYLLTLTYDGTNLKGYVNTSLISSSSPGAVINYTVNPVQIGAMNSALEYLNGYVSDAMIYNRALSSDEVSQNFNALRRRYGI